MGTALAHTAQTLVSNEGSELDLYYREVSQFDVMTAEQELETARRWFDDGDTRAAHALVTANLRFVIKIANEYKRYGVRMLDLIQEGNVGLMKAVQKFDPNKGYRLITYAVWWIRAQIHDYILRSWSMVRIGTTRSQRKLFNRLQSTQKRIRALIGANEGEGAQDGAEVDEDALLAAELDIPVDEVAEFRRRVKTPDLSLEERVHEDGEAMLRDRVVDDGPNQEESVGEAQVQERLAARLHAAVGELNEREQIIVRERLLAEDPVMLKDLGERFGVSKERVRQLEARAKKKLRTALEGCEVSFL